MRSDFTLFCLIIVRTQALSFFLMTKNTLNIIGVMSGTSVDTLDIALMEISRDKTSPPKLLHYCEYDYSEELRQKLIKLSNSSHLKEISLDDFSRLNSYLGCYYGEQIKRFLKETGYAPDEIDLIGSHGQTISHTPNVSFDIATDGFEKAPASLQIGDGDCIAKATGITTVSDFRMADIASGGEGAPLSPACHQLFFGNAAPRVIAVNLGGICNITYLEQGNPAATVAFDTGPANMVLDGLITKLSDGEEHYDKDGNIAREGETSPELLKILLKNPYFEQAAPKSCGRREFGEHFVDLLQQEGEKLKLLPEDIIRTALEVTVISLRDAITKQVGMEFNTSDLIVGMGGGTRNSFLMERIQEELSPAKVITSDEMGINSSAFEAVCFGWLGYLCVTEQPFPLPGVTGAKTGNVYGKVCR